LIGGSVVSVPQAKKDTPPPLNFASSLGTLEREHSTTNLIEVDRSSIDKGRWTRTSKLDSSGYDSASGQFSNIKHVSKNTWDGGGPTAVPLMLGRVACRGIADHQQNISSTGKLASVVNSSKIPAILRS